MVIVQLGGDSSNKRKYFTDEPISLFENAIYGISSISKIYADKNEFEGEVFPLAKGVTKLDLYLYPQFLDNLGIVSKGIPNQAGLYELPEKTALSFFDYLKQNSLQGECSDIIERFPSDGTLAHGVREFMESINSAKAKSYDSFLSAMGLSKKRETPEPLETIPDFKPENISDFHGIASALQAKQFLIFTGLSGSGKTLQALSFAKWITPCVSILDVFQPGAEIQSANVTYLVGKSDQTSVEFWNSVNPAEAVKVTLPREMIEEWATYIRQNEIPKTTQAREIREVVKVASKFSDQLHSFETHLKAAAFALLNNQTKESTAQYELISVGADWTSNENLLGYPNALEAGKYCKPDNGVLDLILHAQQHPELPYFLILDEMNLSHVERYFADFLSAMESGEPIHLHEDTGEDWNGVPAKLSIPKNLFVIGTVNVDETTYMFSPKVLDRANVIEFRVSENEMSAFLENPVKPDLDSIAGQGTAYAKVFTAAAKQKDVELDPDTKEAVQRVLMDFFSPLQAAGAEFGYRTAHEICRFVYFHRELSGDGWSLNTAMDAAVMQKLLPKLHGSKKKLEKVLNTMMRLCLVTPPEKDDPLKEEHLQADNIRYPVALKKLQRMQDRLAQHGFTSFAEA